MTDTGFSYEQIADYAAANNMAMSSAYTALNNMSTAEATSAIYKAEAVGYKADGLVPTQSSEGPNAVQGLTNDTFGTSFGLDTGFNTGTNKVGYVDSAGQQMHTGNLTGNAEATAWLEANPELVNMSNSDYNAERYGEPAASNSAGLGDITGAQWGQLGLGTAGLVTNAYFAHKNLGLQEDRDDYLKSRDARSDARTAKVQSNYEASMA